MMARGSVAPTMIKATSTQNHNQKTSQIWGRLKSSVSTYSSKLKGQIKNRKTKLINQSINSEAKEYLYWSFIIAMASLYNMWAIPLRWAFQLDDSKPWIYTNKNVWMPLDYVFDLVFVFDTFLIAPKIQIVKDGSVVADAKQLRTEFFGGRRFKFDVIAILPFDFLFLLFDWHNGWSQLLRINRFFKNCGYFNFLNKCEQLLPNPYVFRITKTLINLLYVIHITTCLYFAMSTFSGIGSNSWAYDGKIETKYVSAYIRCFYWALKTVTSIGNEKIPTTRSEIVFSMMNYLGEMN